MIYYAFFYSAVSYGIIFWENLSHSSVIFRIKKKQLETLKDVGLEFCVKIYLSN
jgi:hypothetical protein